MVDWPPLTAGVSRGEPGYEGCHRRGWRLLRLTSPMLINLGVCRGRPWLILPAEVEQQEREDCQGQDPVAALHRLISPLTGK
nr:hypothetical protein [Aeromonas salmonicida]